MIGEDAIFSWIIDRKKGTPMVFRGSGLGRVLRKRVFGVGTGRCVVIWSLCAGLFCSGCVTTESTIYLQQLDSETPANQIPIFVTIDQKEGDVQLSGFVSTYNGPTLAGKAESPQFTAPGLDSAYAPRPEGILWTPSKGIIALSARYLLSKQFAMSGSVNYAWGTSGGMVGGSVGLAVCGSGSALGYELSAGIQIRAIEQEARSVVVQSTTDIFGTRQTTVGYSSDRTRSTIFDFYGALTLNTAVRDFPLNGILQVAITEQTLGSFVPSGDSFWVEDTRLTEGVTMFQITPGVVIRLGQSETAVIGVRMSEFLTTRHWDPGRLWFPFVQFSVTLSQPSE